MAISDQHWHVVSTSPFPWEQEALDYLRQNLPDAPGWEVWPLFEFIADTGALYEVDLLVLCPSGLWLVEIKSQPGKLRGNQQTWTFTQGNAVRAIDNPLFLVNRKTKALKSLLEHRIGRGGIKVPFIGVLVFLSAKELELDLNPDTRAWVCVRDVNDAVPKGLCTGVVAGLKTGRFVGATPDPRGQISPREVPTLLEQLRDATGTTQGPPGCWLLVAPMHRQRLPRIDGVALPVIGSAQYMTIDPGWVRGMVKADAS